MKGKIIKLVSNDYTVKLEDEEIVCKARGKFRNDGISPLVGDNVIVDKENAYIIEVLPRKNELTRPSIANVDQAIIIMSVKEPDFSSNLLDKLLVTISVSKVKPIICFTKLDLLKENEKEKIQNIINYYSKLYDTYTNANKDIIKIFKNKISVFTGQSGAGKSTLLNKLDNKLNIKTGEISHALNRGKHTTRHVELLKVNDGLVADTPGFSAIDLSIIKDEKIRNSFIEFNSYICEYKNCMHNKEDECEVKKHIGKEILLSRYKNYIKFLKR